MEGARDITDLSGIRLVFREPDGSTSQRTAAQARLWELLQQFCPQSGVGLEQTLGAIYASQPMLQKGARRGVPLTLPQLRVACAIVYSWIVATQKAQKQARSRPAA